MPHLQTCHALGGPAQAPFETAKQTTQQIPTVPCQFATVQQTILACVWATHSRLHRASRWADSGASAGSPWHPIHMAGDGRHNTKWYTTQVTANPGITHLVGKQQSNLIIVSTTANVRQRTCKRFGGCSPPKLCKQNTTTQTTTVCDGCCYGQQRICRTKTSITGNRQVARHTQRTLCKLQLMVSSTSAATYALPL